MTKAAMKTLLAAAIGAATFNLGLVIESAQAFTLTYDFTVEITRGFCAVGNTLVVRASCDISGGTYVSPSTTFKGKATYDASKLTGKGIEDLTPGVGNLSFTTDGVRLAQADLKIQFGFLGRSFTEVDDFQYPKSGTSNILGYPRLRFQDGKLQGLDYLVVPPSQNFLGFQIFRDTFYVAPRVTTDANGVVRKVEGYPVGKVIPPAVAAPVPEPSEIGGLLIVGGLLGLRVWKTRSRSKFSPSIDDAIEVENHAIPNEQPAENLK